MWLDSQPQRTEATRHGSVDSAETVVHGQAAPREGALSPFPLDSLRVVPRDERLPRVPWIPEADHRGCCRHQTATTPKTCGMLVAWRTIWCCSGTKQLFSNKTIQPVSSVASLVKSHITQSPFSLYATCNGKNMFAQWCHPGPWQQFSNTVPLSCVELFLSVLLGSFIESKMPGLASLNLSPFS